MYIYMYVHRYEYTHKTHKTAMHALQQKTAHEPLSHNTTSYMNIHALFYLVRVFGLDLPDVPPLRRRQQP